MMFDVFNNLNNYGKPDRFELLTVIVNYTKAKCCALLHCSSSSFNPMLGCTRF